MTAEILVVAPIPPSTNEPLEKAFTSHYLTKAPDKAKMLAEVGPRVRGVLTSGGAGISGETIAKLPKLEIVAVVGVGYDPVDLPACKARGIRVTNTPDVLTDDVADVAIGLTLNVMRRFVAADKFVRAGDWLKGGQALTEKVGGKTVGIIGMGRIGQAIARRAAAMEATVVYHGPRAKNDVPYRYYPNLAEMAADVNVLIAACPGGEATRGIVNAKVIEALGTKGYFVNISRGSVVDEPALVKALVEGKLGGAGLDVFVDEPKVPEALFTLDNVVLAPHVGSATRETRKAMGDLAVANLVAHFAGKPLLTPVA